MVRIFCLTSITKIPEQIDDVQNQPYDDVIERLWRNEKEKMISALRCLKRDEPSYRLTRHIFSKRGAVKFIEIKKSKLKNAFDLVIATSKQYDNYVENIDFDIYLKVRCIKNTKERYITQTEEELYKSYAKKLNNIEKDLREAELIKNPLILPNKSEANVLRTKLSDISILIRLLCDRHTGSVENVLPKRDPFLAYRPQKFA
uniref:Uncharacterized protein n=1 Tax=Panagrolaimus davidi TaxID=227884 RepID=A0A914PR88_9BILA